MSEQEISEEEIAMYVQRYQEENASEINTIRMFIETWVYLATKGLFDFDEFFQMKRKQVSRIDQHMEEVIREKVLDWVRDMDPKKREANTFLLNLLNKMEERG